MVANGAEHGTMGGSRTVVISSIHALVVELLLSHLPIIPSLVPASGLSTSDTTLIRITNDGVYHEVPRAPARGEAQRRER
jgi:hypothetical protein